MPEHTCACGCGSSSQCRCERSCPCGCGYSTEQMFAFLDDRDGAACGCHAEGLDPEQRAQLDRGRLEAIAAHVASCPSCQARLARERALRSATATSAAAAAPDYLRARVRATLRVTTITTRRLTRG